MCRLSWLYLSVFMGMLNIHVGLSAAAVLVEASGDVTVHVVSVSDWSTGSYVALPLDELGTNYYVMTFSSPNEARALWQVCIVSLVDNTVIQLSLATGTSRLRPLNVGLDIASIHLESTATVVLNSYQTFQVMPWLHVK